ncbi:hypothetical protein [Streptomyces sp. NPDC048312]|uniref:hypothetical protein n=1 Tax=Streptomyces sp. NPDC048312 TaxID=3155485 RepID=UPI0033C0D5C9
MVSSPHEAMHRIFQEYPGLFSRVSEVLGVDIPPPTSATTLPTDLTEARPVERRVDTLLRIETEHDGPFVLAIEAQGKKDPRKTASWPYIADPIVELTAQGLGNRPAAQQWRNLVAVDTSFYKSFMSEEIRDEGRAEGRAEGILLVLEARGIDLPDETREKITSCDDPQLLRQWLSRAATAATIEEVFTGE